VYPQNKFCLQILLLRSLWCTCVQSLLVLLEGTDTICRQSNHVYASSFVCTMFKKIEKPAACEMRSVIHFLNARNMKPANIHCQLCEVYAEHVISDSMIRRWTRHFNEGHENVHDDPWSGRPSADNDVWCVQWKRRFMRRDDSPFHHFPSIFRKFNGNFFTKLCLISFVFGNYVHGACRRCLQMNAKLTSDLACLVRVL
jgi:hypothetical protein